MERKILRAKFTSMAIICTIDFIIGVFAKILVDKLKTIT